MPYNFAINQSQKDRLFADIAIDTDKIVVPQVMVDNWQQTLDLLSELVDTPAALIMRVHQTDIEVFTSSRTQGNPYKKHDKDSLGHGLYCETVIKGGKELHIPNALKDKDWDKKSGYKTRHDCILWLTFTLAR